MNTLLTMLASASAVSPMNGEGWSWVSLGGGGEDDRTKEVNKIRRACVCIYIYYVYGTELEFRITNKIRSSDDRPR